ncbi:hypothetical protein H5071_18015, partial [Shewanella sp. SR41-2]|nr:hypothetical protein [Shewanella sp. SR41-2]
GGTVIIGSLGAIPLTGGASSAIKYLAIAGATAGSLQCMNGLIRVGAEAYIPEAKDDFDSQEWYQNATIAVDLVSLAGAGAAALGTIKAIKIMQFGTSKNTYEILKGLSRAEKKRLNREITRLNLPGASGKLIKAMARKNNIKKYTGKQITHAFRLHLMDAVGASMSVSGSLFNGTSGTMAIGIYEELAD